MPGGMRAAPSGWPSCRVTPRSRSSSSRRSPPLREPHDRTGDGRAAGGADLVPERARPAGHRDPRGPGRPGGRARRGHGHAAAHRPGRPGGLHAAPPDLARALVCAAVRETFEESGVLLAGETAGTVVADPTSDDWERDRNALLDRSLSLAELLARRHLVLRSDLLRSWSRWITPVIEPRRYDTRFFAAAMPAGQRTRDVGGEAAAVYWTGPQQALDTARRGEIALLPPTAVTLAELAACGDLDGALARVPDPGARRPEVLRRDGAAWLTVPGVTEYPL